MKKTLALVFIGCMALASGVQAQYLTGTLTGDADPNWSFFSRGATASSMQISWSNMVQSASGSFAGVVQDNSEVASTGYEIDGLSTTPTTVSIEGFLWFIGEGQLPFQYRFDLDTLTEDSYDAGTGEALFTGTGTIIDNTRAYANTPADLTVTFSDASDYTFSLEAVPEPATMSLAAAGLPVLLAVRRRRN